MSNVNELDDFIESPVSNSRFESDRMDSEMWHGRGPQYMLKAERPIHRVMILKSMEGYTNVEIAAEMGCTPTVVNYVLNQPWAKEYIVKNLHKSGIEKVEILLREAACPAVLRLITEMDNQKARSSERASAADKLLDRLFGRAAQPIIHKQEVDTSKMSDSEIDAELAQLKALRASRS